MKIVYLLFTIIFLITSTSASAQRNKRKSKKAKEKEEVVVIDPRIQIMTSATQKIIFIDSIVVDKTTFLDYYQLSPETGSIHKSDDFWRKSNYSGKDTYVNLNGFRNKCYISEYKDTLCNLYESNLYGEEWSQPKELKGIADTALYKHLNYPYMMPDGYTFYFAATGNESIGGYDIFVTRYDSSSGNFLKAENIGMPFNSTSNDYMYVIDDFNNIGWFATDRNQPNGKVCVYTFIPNETRKTYNNLTVEQLEKYARIHSIESTWKNARELRDEALDRIASNKARIKTESDSECNKEFIINDKLTYTEIDFNTPETKDKYKRLLTLRSKLTTIGKALDIARNFYATASDTDKTGLKDGILKNENEFYIIESEITQLEKELRNTVNNSLGK